MNHLLLAAAFVAMILAPCLTAINAGGDAYEGFDEEEEAC